MTYDCGPYGRFLTRPEAEALGYTVEHVMPDGRVRSMATKEGYSVVYGAPSYALAASRADQLAPVDTLPEGQDAEERLGAKQG